MTDCFSGQECTEDGADSNAIKAMQDRKRQDNSRGQTAEIKRSLDGFIIPFKIARTRSRGKISGWNDQEHAVVGEADAEAHQRKPEKNR